MPAYVVDNGQSHYIDVLDPGTRAAQTTTYFGGWGSGGATDVSPPGAITRTTLVAEFADTRGTATITQPAADKIKYNFVITAGVARTASEAAVFTASTAGTMCIRGTHPDRTVASGDQVEYILVARAKAPSET